MRDLFERFLGDEDAARCAEDIRLAEQMLQHWPAPEPDGELIEDIKAAVSLRLQHNKTFRRPAYKVAAVAAIVIILSFISTRFLDREHTTPERVYIATLAPAIWESEDICIDDAILSVLSAQIEQIESELLALQLGEDERNGDTAVTELEMEFEDIVSDFWKG